MQPGLIADDDDGLVGQIQRPLVIGARDVGVTGGVDDKPGQIDRFAFQRSSGVQPCQQQHVPDELRHPFGFGFDAAHRVGDVLGEVVSFALRQFGIAANRGQRCAQFVAGVGDELAYACLAGVPRGQSACDGVQHSVQRRAELSDLGVRAGRIDLDDRRGQPHLAAIELEGGYLPGRFGNP